MRLFDKKTNADLVRLIIFIVATTMATGLLVITIGNLSFGAKTTYQAEFTDATGLVKGDDIRIAGVKVGAVEDIEVFERNMALVTFKVDEGTNIDTDTELTIRYRNLIGQRYIALTQGEEGGSEVDPEEPIPASRTHPALDLNVLFNGFQPLFEALSPDDVNRLSYEIVQVFQGEGGTLESLLASTASVTTTLADRDEVIDALLENLDYVLDHVADRDEQLGNLIDSFQNLITGLKNDRQTILDSLNGISDIAVKTAGLVADARPLFVKDIKQLRTTAATLKRGRPELDRLLQVLPVKLNKIGRTATYGAWFNFHLCDFVARLRIGGQVVDLRPDDGTASTVQYHVGGVRCPLEPGE